MKRLLALLAILAGAGVGIGFGLVVDGDLYVEADWAWRWLGTPLVVLFTLWVVVRVRWSVTSGKGLGEGPLL
ncbi:hypothetical protein [Parvularcula dongshanensis]|uniref:Uncharacterized protein n=1 Tax=Parvularcula dongshanensis TaxID=1173995 RepID=A0A840I7P6_9PROT|nr:hypothetical protein [Parvularcula dongshanensis]MBB4660194.1 hypothetical protein [Parvularcula dongshanensis]